MTTTSIILLSLWYLSDMYANSCLSQKVESIAEKDYVTLSEDTLVTEAAKVSEIEMF